MTRGGMGTPPFLRFSFSAGEIFDWDKRACGNPFSPECFRPLVSPGNLKSSACRVFFPQTPPRPRPFFSPPLFMGGACRPIWFSRCFFFSFSAKVIFLLRTQCPVLLLWSDRPRIPCRSYGPGRKLPPTYFRKKRAPGVPGVFRHCTGVVLANVPAKGICQGGRRG